MEDSWTREAETFAQDLRRFGIAGGFRERDTVAVPARLVELRSVELRARLDRVDTIEAARLTVADAIRDGLEERRGQALVTFLQVGKPSGWGRDVTKRRAQAGAKMTSDGKPSGISGRTWERVYELPACRDLALVLTTMDLDIGKGDELMETPRLSNAWPITLAVLPFRYAHGALDEALVDGFADDIISRLSRLTGLAVISPTASRAWMLEPDPLGAARERAGVDLVLVGSIRQADDVLHVTLRIEETASRKTRWSASLTFQAGDLLGAQLEVADAVLKVLDHPQGPSGFEISGGDTADASAYELYLRGVGLVVRNTEVETELALNMFGRALELDDSFANAHANRGYALWRQYFSGWAGREALDEALTSVDRALHLDPSSTAARLTRIRICWDLGLHEEALREGKRAIGGNPQARQARLSLARALNNAGLADLALPLTRTILRAEPREVSARKLLIWNLLMTRDYEEAATDGIAYLKLNPRDANTSWAVAGALLAADEHDEAVQVCSQALKADMAEVTLWLLKGYVLRAAGSPTEATAVWEEGAATVAARIRLVGENDRVRVFLANIHACLNDVEAVHRDLEQLDEREPGSAYIAYRCAGALAELADIDGALQRLQRAFAGGFLSAQLMRFEERLALAPLKRTLLYEQRTLALENKVDGLRQQYSPLVHALVQPVNGGANDEQE
jgi:TolB-like protein